ncbi:MAG TPA: DUF3341 domain-containing protein [Polyangiaceae bacterium]|jgi:hypothetical protein|nr:DUF3341 domain-containing protein [Polyangiaceae bacterium]
MSKHSVVGIVDTRARAENIVAHLNTLGITAGDISVLLPDKRGNADFVHENNTKAPEGAAIGAAGGGVIGGAVGLLAGLGALAIPGLGPLVAAGPLMAALSGAAAGATVGGVGGALVGLGMPEIEAKKYEGKIVGGNILLAVHVDDRDEQKRVSEILERGGAQDISAANEAAVPKRADSQRAVH